MLQRCIDTVRTFTWLEWGPAVKEMDGLGSVGSFGAEDLDLDRMQLGAAARGVEWKRRFRKRCRVKRRKNDSERKSCRQERGS